MPLSCAGAQAMLPPPPLGEDIASLDLRPFTEYWVEDPANKGVSLEELRALDQSSGGIFSASPGEDFSFGYTGQTYWFRWQLPVAPSGEAEWWLQIAPTFLDHADLYVPSERGQYRQVRLGDHVALAERPVRSRHFLVPLELTRENAGVYYLRVQSTSTITLGLTLWQPERYINALAVENSLYGLLFGLILAAVVISLISGFWIRKPFYFVMASFLVFNGLMHLTLNGYDQILFNLGGDWPDRLMGVSVNAAGALGVALCMVYLNPSDLFPRLSRYMWGVAVLSGLGALVSLLGSPSPRATAVGGVILMLSISALIIVMLRRRFVPSLLMFILFVPGVLALLSQLARNFSLLPLNFWTTHIWSMLTILQVPYIAVVVMLHVRVQEREFLSAQQKARLHRDLFSMVAHELRTPLAVVGSAVANIELQTREAQPELAPRFQRANLGLARLNSLIDNALAEDRLLGESMQLQCAALTLAQLVERVCELRPVEPPHERVLVIQDGDTPLFIDAHWLGLAILNLVDNAIKYSPEGGAIRIHTSRQEPFATVEVVDHGIGIPAEAVDKIFEKFFRADNAQNMRGSSGLGLGLFLVHTVVTLHGGTLAYRANPAGGSIFTLSLPLYSAASI